MCENRFRESLKKVWKWSPTKVPKSVRKKCRNHGREKSEKSLKKVWKKFTEKCREVSEKVTLRTSHKGTKTHAGARAKRARPLLGGGRRPPPLYLPKSVKKVSGKCLGDTFLTFSGHFSSANPSTRTLSRHFLDIFLGGCQEAPKGILGHFWTFFGNFSFWPLLRT